MLNSCAANVSVVNIDAGFKGGYVAGLIAQAAARRLGLSLGINGLAKGDVNFVRCCQNGTGPARSVPRLLRRTRAEGEAAT